MTTGFQFAHCDWYSQSGSKSKASFGSSHGVQRGRGWTNAEILAEATRKPGHCGHVPAPAPPGICHGSVEAVEEAIEEFVASQVVTVKLKNGKTAVRKARADSPSMAAGVISLPRERIDEWQEFRDHAIDQLKQRHGDRLRCVLEHLDEAHPHLHFYLVPRPGEDFGIVHDGYAASREARKQPENKIRTAFKDAMVRWQDWVQESICRPFGLARLGPGRTRKSRKEWKADEIARLNEREELVKAKESALKQREKHLDLQIRIHESRIDILDEEYEKKLIEINRLYQAMSGVQRAALHHHFPNIDDFLRPAAKKPLSSLRPK